MVLRIWVSKHSYIPRVLHWYLLVLGARRVLLWVCEYGAVRLFPLGDDGGLDIAPLFINVFL